MATVVGVFGLAIYALAIAGTPFLSELDLPRALLVAFALSFSSTVFVVKALEQRGDVASLQGRIAVGILIVQDLAAVGFLAVSSGEWPSWWALLVLLLIPLRPVLHRLLLTVGHGELLVLYAFLLAMGGAELFELVGLKGDLGALVLGLLIANHEKADEMAKTMLSFKDLFLLGFFLSVGLSGQPTAETALVGVLLSPLVLLKAALFFVLLTGLRLRARTSLLISLNLANFSEFGLIVAAIGVEMGWIDSQWLIVLAIALSVSFAMAAALNSRADTLYSQRRQTWTRLQKQRLIADDQLLDTRGAAIGIIGMGRIGSGAYDTMRQLHGETVIGVDTDPITTRTQQAKGRNVLHGDPSDADFWDRVQATHSLELVMLALPKLTTSLAVLQQLEAAAFSGRVAVTARFPDEVEILEKAGADVVFNIYSEAGAGFAWHAAGLDQQNRLDTYARDDSG